MSCNSFSSISFKDIFFKFSNLFSSEKTFFDWNFFDCVFEDWNSCKMTLFKIYFHLRTNHYTYMSFMLNKGIERFEKVWISSVILLIWLRLSALAERWKQYIIISRIVVCLRASVNCATYTLVWVGAQVWGHLTLNIYTFFFHI